MEYLCRTAISMEESGSQEQIFEKLKLHKEVLSGVKQQPWPLRRKIKLVRQAKSYVRRHEGVLQERLAQTRSTKDAIARVSLFATKVIISEGKLFASLSRAPSIFINFHSILEMAIFPQRDSEPPNVADSLGISHKRDRVAFWLGGSLVLHFPSMAVLD